MPVSRMVGAQAELRQIVEKGRDRFMRHAVLVEYRKGDTISATGESALAVRYVSSGFGATTMLTSLGSEVAFAPVFRGQVLTVTDMFAGINIPTVKALTNMNVYEMYPERFDELSNDAGFLRWCMAVVASNHLMMPQFAAIRSIPNIDDRVIGFFRMLHFIQAGSVPDGDFSVEWPGSQTVLAQMLNVSRPYINDKISRMQQEGRLLIENEVITVSPRNVATLGGS